MRRATLKRESVDVEALHGTIAVRVARAPDGTAKVARECESCRQAAVGHKVPLKIVYQAAIAAYDRALTRGKQA